MLQDLGKFALVATATSAGVYHFGSRALGAPSTVMETALSAVVAPAAALYVAMQVDNTYDSTKQALAVGAAAGATSYYLAGSAPKAGLAVISPCSGYYVASAIYGK